MLEHAPDAGDTVIQQALGDGNLHQALLDQLEEGIYMVDRDRRILYWNGGAERISGYRAHEVAGHFCHGDLLMHCDSDGAVLCGRGCPLTAVMQDGRARECTVFLRHRQGHRLPVRVQSRPIRNAGGEIIGAVEVFEEAVAARHGMQALRPFGCLDPVSDAVHRSFGEMKLRHALEKLHTFGIPFGWLRIGLDSAEDLEHRFGQAMVDAAVRVIAATLNSNLKALDVLTRWDHTEFRVEMSLRTQVVLAEVAEKLVALVRMSGLDWWGDRVAVAVSIGGAMVRNGDTLDSLEARVQPVFENCRAAGGNRAAVHAEATEGAPCLP
jgi:PAS domain S-box-containing protein/diguanylate cyclase (GGDEF)-like protein